MSLPRNKTKIVSTVGPASDHLSILEEMIRAGTNVFRMNFSHGDLDSMGAAMRRIREASRAVGTRVAILADLPGPKIRIGEMKSEATELRAGHPFTLTTEEILGSEEAASVQFARLSQVVGPGDRMFLNDGSIQLEVVTVEGPKVECMVVSGGSLSSRKGLNLPEVDLGVPAFTDRDRECLDFALGEGVDAVSQSFVEKAADLRAVREAAASAGHQPFLIAKIERARALQCIDEIITEADGIMVARGDLGVEVSIERIALVQKQLIRKANQAGKPVITATQMLESMTTSRRPTRAEATDVANAILDGTDAVMLSGESAVGKYPVEAVETLARIAEVTEPSRPALPPTDLVSTGNDGDRRQPSDLVAISVATATLRATPAAVVVPTRGGATARRISRFRLPVWVAAVSSSEKTCRDLLFSYGVIPVLESEHPTDWRPWIEDWLVEQGIDGSMVFLTEGPSRKHPGRNHRLEIIELSGHS